MDQRGVNTRLGLNQLQMDSVSPSTKLLEKRRLMYEVQEAFDRQKEEERRKEEIFRKKEAELRARDLYIQEQLIHFNKALQENEAKQTRARKRAEDERNAINQKQSNKVKLEGNLTEIQEESKKIERDLTDQ